MNRTRQPKVKGPSDLLHSPSIVLIDRISPLSPQIKACQVLRYVLADGSASLCTGEAFTCRIWMKNAFVILHDSGIVSLGADIGEFRSLLETRKSRMLRMLCWTKTNNRKSWVWWSYHVALCLSTNVGAQKVGLTALICKCREYFTQDV